MCKHVILMSFYNTQFQEVHRRFGGGSSRWSFDTMFWTLVAGSAPTINIFGIELSFFAQVPFAEFCLLKRLSSKMGCFPTANFICTGNFQLSLVVTFWCMDRYRKTMQWKQTSRNISIIGCSICLGTATWSWWQLCSTSLAMVIRCICPCGSCVQKKRGRELEVDISARNHRLVLCHRCQRCWTSVAVLGGTFITITGWVRGSQCFHAVVRGPGFVFTTFSKKETPALCRGCFSANRPRPSFLLPHATKTRWWPAPAT